MSMPLPWARTSGNFQPNNSWQVNHEHRWKQGHSASSRQWLIQTQSPAGPPAHIFGLEQSPGSTNSVRTSRLARLEAILFVADGPLPIKKLANLASLTDVREAEQMIRWLNQSYHFTHSPYQIYPLAGGYQLLTKPDYQPWLTRLNTTRKAPQLTPSTLETLAIIAYRQPVTRADVEQIRGVQCVDILKQLMEDGYVRLAGEDTSLGRPYLYETTRKFLEDLGLASLDDLPHRDTFPSRHSNANNGKSEKAA